MKKLKQRTLFVLLFILLLSAGLVTFCVFYVLDGAQWASFSANKHVYTEGKIASGAICDRDGTVLYDCAAGTYSTDKTTRVSTLHAVGDRYGNIATGAKTVFSDQLVGFSLITGTSGTGNTISLTLDADLNNAAYNAMAGQKGAVALYNYRTGDILCMLSTPAYDPDDKAEIARVDAGDSKYDGAYLYRFLSSTYTPGSTFKLVTAIAGLMEGIIDPSDTIFCGGSYTVEGWTMGDGRPFRAYCHQRSGHGTENLVKAIKDSCNVYFYDVGRRVGIEKLNEYAKMFGLGQHTGIETGDAEGTIAGPETSRANNQAWYDGATLYAAIGQENNQFTPLQIANYLATLVNGGDRYSVHLLDSVRSHDNSELLYQYEPELLSSIGIPEDYLATIKEGMYQVSQNAAIARYFNNLPVRVGAKTGTAEIQGGEDSETNGLLVVFAPYDDPEIAVARLLEARATARAEKNWAVAECGSEVRAMAMVYLRLRRPLSASFLMGARVVFSRRLAVMPPPWIMKSLMTRWKMVPSYWPALTYSRKLAVVMGALRASRRTRMSPMLVSSLTTGSGPWARMAWGAASRAQASSRTGSRRVKRVNFFMKGSP